MRKIGQSKGWLWQVDEREIEEEMDEKKSAG